MLTCDRSGHDVGETCIGLEVATHRVNSQVPLSNLCICHTGY